jgi:hypothetical protein
MNYDLAIGWPALVVNAGVCAMFFPLLFDLA